MATTHRSHARIKSSLHGRSWLVAVFLAAAAGCFGEPVGRKCFLGAGLDAGSPTQSVISGSALDCPTRTCLYVPLPAGHTLPPGSEYSQEDGLCTAACSSDGDCERVPESPCKTGFTCAIPVVVGPFCCRKMCICRDYLQIPTGGLRTPAACVPEDNRNQCCNLPNRSPCQP